MINFCIKKNLLACLLGVFFALSGIGQEGSDRFSQLVLDFAEKKDFDYSFKPAEGALVINIKGASNAVPEKLVKARVTKCSMLTIENTSAAAPNTTINILVMESALLSSEVNNDLNSVPRAKI